MSWMTKIFGALFLGAFLFIGASAQTKQALSGFCEEGGQTVTVAGITSSTKVQKSYPGCTVTVYDAGTLSLSTIFADAGGTPKANPFTANGTTGFWTFYANPARYDVQLSGAGMSTVTRGGLWVVAAGGNGDVVGPGSSTDEAVVRFDGTTGKLLQNSVVTLSDTGTFSFPDNVRQTFNPGATNAGLNVGSVGSEPAVGQNGDQYYNSGLGKFRCFQAGSWMDCISPGGGGSSLTVRELDGSPSVNNVVEIRVSNSTLTDNGGGSVSVTTGGGGSGGTPGGADLNLQYRVDASTFGGVPGSVVGTNGELFLSVQPRSGAVNIAYRFLGSQDSTMTADTEKVFGSFETSAVRQWNQGGGSFNLQREWVFLAPTYSFTSADSIQTVATLGIENAPQTGTNATFGDAYALLVQAGKSKFGGKVETNVTGSTLAAIRIGIKADPDPSTPLNGDMYYNTTNNKFRCYENSAWVNCVGGTGIAGTAGTNSIAYGVGVNTIGFESGFSYDPTTNVFRISNTGLTAAVDWFLDTDAGSNPRVKWQGNTNTVNFAFFNNGGTDELFRISRYGEVFVLAKNRGAAATLPYFQVVSPTETALPADTEQIGMMFGDFPLYNRQFTAGGGAFALQREVVITQPRYAFTSSDTITRATTWTFLGPPIAGTNATITTPETLRVESGQTTLLGALTVVATAATDAGISFTGTSVNQTRSHASTQTIPWITIDSGAINDLTTGVDIKEIWYRFDNGDFNYSTAATTALYESILIAKRNITGDAATRTITTGITFSVDGPPTAGANAAITNPLTAAFKSGTVRFGTPSSQTGAIQFAVSGDADTIKIQGGDTPDATLTYKWPSVSPTASQVLSASAPSGGIVTLSWASGGGGGNCTVAGSQGDYQINNGASGCAAGVITQGTNGRLISSPTAVSSGVTAYYTLNIPTDTNLTASTDTPGFRVVAGTRQHATGAITTQRENVWDAVTYSFVGASTVTNAIGNEFRSPVAGTNATLTNSMGIQVVPSAATHQGVTVAHTSTNSTGAFYRGSTGGADRFQILPFDLGGSRVGVWINMTTAGPSGLGSGGVGSAPWIAFADTTDAYFIGAAANDIAYRSVNTTSRLIFGNDGTTGAALTIGGATANLIGVNKMSSIGGQFHIVSGATSRIAEVVDSATNSTVDLISWNLNADDTSTVANLGTFRTNSNGTAANGFGQSITFQLESSTTNDRDAGKLSVLWNSATDSGRTSVINIATVDNSQALRDVLTISGNGLNTGSSLNQLGTNGAETRVGTISENLTLNTGGTTTDTTIDLPANSIILSVSTRVTTTITTAVSFSVGDPTTAARFSASAGGMSAGSTRVGLDHMQGSVATNAAGPVQTTAAKVRITTNANPGAGAIRITIHYINLLPAQN